MLHSISTEDNTINCHFFCVMKKAKLNGNLLLKIAKLNITLVSTKDSQMKYQFTI